MPWLIIATLFFTALCAGATFNCLGSCYQSSTCPAHCTVNQLNVNGLSSCSNVTYSSQPYRFCRCDTDCSFFGDCCQFVGNCSLNTEPPNSLDWQCRSTGGITEQISIGDNIITGLPHVLMVATCNPQWLLSQPLTFATKVQQQCEDPDIVPASPVTSQASGITYGNVYCAQCNSERFVDLVFWLQQYACPTANSTMKTCKIFWRFVEPQVNSAHRVARSCIPKVISVCSSNYSNATVIQKCREYSNPVVWAGKIFKNVECALCNDVLSTVPLATCAMIKLQGYTHTSQELDIAQMHFDGCYSYADSDFYALEYNLSQSTVPTFQDINFNCTEVTTLCLGNCLSTKRDVSHYRSGGRENRAPPTSPGSTPNATDPHKEKFGPIHPVTEAPTSPVKPTQGVPINTYMYTARPTYSLLFDVHSSGYDIIQGTTTVTTVTIPQQCATGEVFLPGAGGGGHCVPVVTFQCYVTPNTASFTDVRWASKQHTDVLVWVQHYFQLHLCSNCSK